MLHMETPSNPLMKITDVRALSALLKPRGILLSIDATMMSPYLMKPLSLGADVVVHSATKFFGGHADAMGGFVVINDPQMVRDCVKNNHRCFNFMINAPPHTTLGPHR